LHWLDDVVAALFLLGLVAGRVVRGRVLTRLEPAQRAQLVSTFDHYQVYSVVGLAGVAAGYALSPRTALPSWLLDGGYLAALLGYVLWSGPIGQRLVSGSGLPAKAARAFAVALALQYAGLAVLIGVALRW
jgi:hypothetical protein